MIAILFLFVVSMIPVLGVWLCIQLFRWLMNRYTGAEVQITPNNYFEVYRHMKTVWHHDPLNFEADGQGKSRKSKHNPHFERLMEQDNAQRLAIAQERIAEVYDDTVQEPVVLASLLQDEKLN